MSKKLGLVLAILVLSLVVSSLAAPMKLAILEFRNTSGYAGAWHIGGGVSDMLATALFKSNKFDVIERERIALVLKEQKFQQTDLVDENSAVEIGKLLGADVIVTGNVTEFGTKRGGLDFDRFAPQGLRGLSVKTQTVRIAMDARLIDVTTGKLLAAESADASHSSGNVGIGIENTGVAFGDRGFDETSAGKATREAVNKMVQKITASLYSAQVASVDGAEVIINIGKKDGVKVGDLFEVKSVGKPIVDPATGKVLGHKKSTAGRIKIIAVEDTFATGTLIDGGANEKDVVEKIEKKK
ncbi:MAG: CsgG/HfaB family protein [bacterium]|nr:CsgG/HfaB family protein [bacterium]